MFRRIVSSTGGFRVGEASSLALSTFRRNGAPVPSSLHHTTTGFSSSSASALASFSNQRLQFRNFGSSSSVLLQQAKRASTSATPGVADPFSDNLYQRLGIPKTASESEIKHAFHRLAKQYHPDANPGDNEAQEKFVHIKEAKNILGNQAKRKIYDETGSQKEADDPRLHRARSLVRTWIPILFVGVCILGFLVNSKVIRPARKSSNLYLRYFINWIGTLLLLYIFPNRFFAATLLVYSHASFYRQDMMADVSDHVVFNVDRSPAAAATAGKKSGGTGDLITIEIVPEDEEVKDSLAEMNLTVVSRDGRTTRVVSGGSNAANEQNKKEEKSGESSSPKRFLVQVPVEDFYENEDAKKKTEDAEKLVTKKKSGGDAGASEEEDSYYFNNYVRVVCNVGGNSFDVMDRKILLPRRQ